MGRDLDIHTLVSCGLRSYTLTIPMVTVDGSLGLRIETLSRTLTCFERSGFVTRVTRRKLLLQNRRAIEKMLV
jgi:hypothetical protein